MEGYFTENASPDKGRKKAKRKRLNAKLERLRDENARLRIVIETAAEAIERGSTSAPIAELLRGALTAGDHGRG